MSNNEPSAIVLQGIACMCRLYKFRFEWRKRVRSNTALETKKAAPLRRRPLLILGFQAALRPVNVLGLETLRTPLDLELYFRTLLQSPVA